MQRVQLAGRHSGAKAMARFAPWFPSRQQRCDEGGQC